MSRDVPETKRREGGKDGENGYAKEGFDSGMLTKGKWEMKREIRELI